LPVALLAFAIPLSPRVAISHLPDRAIELRMEDVIIAIGVTILFLVRGNHVKVPRLIRWFILVWCLAFAGTLLGILNDTIEVARGLLYSIKEIEFLGCALLVFSVSTNKYDREHLYSALSVAASICSMLSIYQYLSGSYWGVAGSRASLPFDAGPFPLGGYMLAVFPVLCVRAIQKRGFSLLPAVLCVIGLILSGSRASIFGLFVEGFAILVLIGGFKYRTGRSAMIILLLLVSVGGVWIFRTGRLSDISSRLTSLFARIYEIWPYWFDAFLSHPILGLGLSAGVVTPNGLVYLADNNYFLALGERGLIGALLYFGGFLVWISRLSSFRKRGIASAEKSTAIGIAVIAGFLVASLATDAFRVIRPAMAFWYTQGIVLGELYGG